MRHPIHTAMLGMARGTALVSGEGHALVAVASFVFIYLRKIRLEEANLARVSGPAWEAYARDARAPIPLLY